MFTATVPGDFDGNLVVDAADYTVWRNNLGSEMRRGRLPDLAKSIWVGGS